MNSAIKPTPERKLKTSDLVRMDILGEDAIVFLELARPEDTGFARAGVPRLVEVCKVMLETWTKLIHGTQPPIAEYTWTCSHGHENTMDEIGIRDRMLLVSCAYYDYATRKLFDNYGKHGKLPPGLRNENIREFFPDVQWVVQNIGDLNTYCNVSVAYFLSMSTAYTIQLARLVHAPSHLTAGIDQYLHESIETLHKHVVQLRSMDLRTTAFRMMRSVLTIATKVYAENDTIPSKHLPGVFSAIRLDELELLAGRAPAVIKRYGQKQVEKVYETQLALIVQSFGLYVVSTQRGQKTVDLVCISGSPNESTFLLEAKTTRGSYSLPSADSRALKEYVATLRRTLVTMPSLKFALIVGHYPSKTLDQKLIDLEADAQLPFRFMTAAQLARLRELLPGPLPMATFIREVTRGNHILADEFIDRIVQSYHIEQSAHTALVGRLLSTQGVGKLQLPWIDDGPVCIVRTKSS